MSVYIIPLKTIVVTVDVLFLVLTTITDGRVFDIFQKALDLF